MVRSLRLSSICPPGFNANAGSIGSTGQWYSAFKPADVVVACKEAILHQQVKISILIHNGAQYQVMWQYNLDAGYQICAKLNPKSNSA